MAGRRADIHNADRRPASAVVPFSARLLVVVGAAEGGIPLVGVDGAVVLAAAVNAMDDAGRAFYGEASLEGADGVVAVGAYGRAFSAL